MFGLLALAVYLDHKTDTEKRIHQAVCDDNHKYYRGYASKHYGAWYCFRVANKWPNKVTHFVMIGFEDVDKCSKE